MKTTTQKQCGKKGCRELAVVSIWVTSAIQQGSYVACAEHAAKFGTDLGDLLRLPYGAEWSIRIYSLTVDGTP